MSPESNQPPRSEPSAPPAEPAAADAPQNAPTGGKPMWTETDIKEKLKEVVDPEIMYNIVDLGLVYGAEIQDQTVKVKMTLTSPMCPLGPQILSAVHASVMSLPMVKDVKIDLVWNPPWDPRTMASEDARMHLGID